MFVLASYFLPEPRVTRKAITPKTIKTRGIPSRRNRVDIVDTIFTFFERVERRDYFPDRRINK